MTRGQIWLESAWPFVRSALPAAPAETIEIGCGTAGGFVPFLLRAGYTAVGIDPQAPDVIAALNARLHQRSCTDGPYVFPDLDNTTESDEQAAIDSGQIQATGIRYIATEPPA